MTKNDFKDLINSGPVILDGATGSNLMKEGMPKGVCTEAWILEHKDIMIALQRSYVEAGSRIIYAPTFSANKVALAEHGLADQMESMIHQLVSLSKIAVDTDCFVAGDLTTTGKTDIGYEDALAVYQEQIKYLVDTNVDLLVAETMLTLDETMAAVEAARSVCDLPLLCSMTIEADGSLFFGGNIFETAAALEELGADAVGINCSTGPDQLESIITNLHRQLSIPIIAKPNAGMPVINAQGEAIYNMSPDQFAVNMKRLIDAGANLVGGCCGTTPEHIKALADICSSDIITI